eukprot:923521-Rhodomonas_salina.1
MSQQLPPSQKKTLGRAVPSTCPLNAQLMTPRPLPHKQIAKDDAEDHYIDLPAWALGERSR